MAPAIQGVIPKGETAPSFRLPGREGGEIAIPVADARGLTLVVFYKNTCPTCRLMLPFIQRTHEQVGPAGGRVVAVSQDGAEGAESIARELGLTMPIAIDGPDYPVSRRYDLVSVPTLYLLKSDGTITRSFTGFHKEQLGHTARELAASVGAAPPQLYREGEPLPDFKPG